MPTFETTEEFDRRLTRLNPEDRKNFRRAVLQKFVPDLESPSRKFRVGLRVRALAGLEGCFEMTWAQPNGRAVFKYGEPIRPGHPHIIWVAVGGHEIFP